MDFGDRLAAKIQADVERRIEMTMSGIESGSVEDVGKAGTRLALFGLLNLVLLVAAIVAIILLIKLVV
jgi:hypothetical protein